MVCQGSPKIRRYLGSTPYWSGVGSAPCSRFRRSSCAPSLRSRDINDASTPGSGCSAPGFRRWPTPRPSCASRVMRRLVQIAALTLALSRAAQGQEASSGAGGGAPIRTLLGDVALVVRDQGDGTLAIGAAGAARSVLLRVRTSDARRWADSVTRLLAAPLPGARRRLATRPGKGKAPAGEPNDTTSAVRARALLEEPGVGAGTLAITRLDSAGSRRWLLFIDDAELSPLRATLERDETTTLARLMRRAATPAVRRPAATPRRPAAKPKGDSAKGAPAKGKAAKNAPAKGAATAPQAPRRP